MPLALLHHVVFEIFEIRTAYIGLDMTRIRIHGHERTAHYLLVVQDGVAGRHQCIDLTFIGEDAHAYRSTEILLYLLPARPLLHQAAVTVGIAHGILDDAFGRFVGGLDEETPRPLHLGIHARLNGGELLAESLLGILLHVVTEGGIYLEAVAVDIVRGSVRLEVLATPAVNGIALPPCQFGLVIPAVLFFGRTRHVEHVAHHLPEIGRYPVVMRNRCIPELYRLLFQRIELPAGNVAVLLHTRHDRIAAGKRPFGIAHGTVTRRRIHHPHQQGRLLYVQLGRLLVEEGLGRRLGAVGIAAVKNRIEVHGDYLLLRIVVLQLDGSHPLLELGDDHPSAAHERIAVNGGVARKEVFGELLRDGAASPLTAVAERERLHRHTGERNEIEARMAVEAGILGGDEGGDEGGRQLLVIDIRPVLYEERTEQTAVVRIYLRSQVALRVFELLERRQPTESSRRGKHQQYQKYPYRNTQNGPEPFREPSGTFLLSQFLAFSLHNPANIAIYRLCIQAVSQ